MHKYEEIISKLTIKQKISLIADLKGFLDPEIQKLGVSPVVADSLFDINAKEGNVYPHFESLANSWNERLIAEVVRDLSARAMVKGVNVIVTPRANAVNSVYEKGLSEDPYLSGSIVGYAAKVISDCGALPCISELALSKTAIDHSDLQFNKAAVKNLYVKPFEYAISKINKFAVQTVEDSNEGAYGTANSQMMGMLTASAKKSFFKVLDKSSGENAINSVKANVVSLSGSYAALQSAYDKYKKLKDAIESGLLDESELEHAINSGTAISEEEIDIAVDFILDFANECKINSESVPAPLNELSASQLCYDAVVASSVLLKNVGSTLPLDAKQKRIALIGDMANYLSQSSSKSLADALKENPEITLTGFAKGYELETDRSDALISEACTLARNCDTVIVVLGTDERADLKIKASRSVKLPANQLALLDAVSKASKKVIALVASDYSLDMSFESKCDAVMLIPTCGVSLASAVAEMIFGKANPSGRLAITRYAHADERFARIRRDKNLGKIKIGQFVGYREYVTANEQVLYPFGYGLSYTNFNYSNLIFANGKASFTVKNNGSHGGIETVQVYLTPKKSAHTNPQRFLAALVKISLKRGESKNVNINFTSAGGYNANTVNVSNLVYETYNSATGLSGVESCNYDVYIGINVNKLKKVGSMYKNGKNHASDNDKLSDYIPTATNVVADGYTLEKTSKTPIPENKKRGAKVATIICILIDVLIVVLSVLSATSGLDLLTLDSDKSNFGLTIGLLIINNFIFVIASIRSKVKDASAEPPVAVAPTAAKFNKAPNTSYDGLFVSEFSDDGIADEEEEEAFDDYATYFDSSIDMPELSRRLIDGAKQHGLKISEKTATATISALACSRLVAVRCEDKKKAEEYARVISEFFGCEYNPYSVNNEFCTTDSLLYSVTETGGYTETPVLRGINRAIDRPHDVGVAVITDLEAQNASTYLSKCLRYVHNPLKSYKISVDKKISGAVCSIPSNVWFVVCLAEGEHVSNLPVNVADATAFINLTADYTEPVECGGNLHPVSYHQFVDMSDSCRNRKQLEESFWKKVDKLTDYVRASSSGFELTNRAWLQIEKFAGVCLTCQIEEVDVLDMVLTAKIIPTCLSVLKNSDVEREISLIHIVEDSFGDRYVNDAVELIKESGIDGNR